MKRVILNLLSSCSMSGLNIEVFISDIDLACDIYDHIRDIDPSIKIDMVHAKYGRRLIALNNNRSATMDISVRI